MDGEENARKLDSLYADRKAEIVRIAAVMLGQSELTFHVDPRRGEPRDRVGMALRTAVALRELFDDMRL